MFWRLRRRAGTLTDSIRRTTSRRSTKLHCRTVKAKPSLAERTYRCEHCGLVIDRDADAAANLAALVRAVNGTRSGPRTGHGDLANA